MEKLNHECLEHIFGFLNCGAKEWLVLSKVCTKWEDVVTRYWKRVDRIEIEDCYHEYNPRAPFLSTKMVISILEYAAQHVRKVNITKRDRINNIKLGNRTYNLSGLNVHAVFESIVKNSCGQILRVNVLANNWKFLDFLMKSNENLEELILTLDCFKKIKPIECIREYNLRSSVNKVNEHNKEEAEQEKKRSDHKNYCTKLCRQIFESFPKLERIAVAFTSLNEENVIMIDEFFSSLDEHKSRTETSLPRIALFYPPDVHLRS